MAPETTLEDTQNFISTTLRAIKILHFWPNVLCKIRRSILKIKTGNERSSTGLRSWIYVSVVNNISQMNGMTVATFTDYTAIIVIGQNKEEVVNKLQIVNCKQWMDPEVENRTKWEKNQCKYISQINK